jgi:hypothetical protein
MKDGFEIFLLIWGVIFAWGLLQVVSEERSAPPESRNIPKMVMIGGPMFALASLAMVILFGGIALLGWRVFIFLKDGVWEAMEVIDVMRYFHFPTIQVEWRGVQMGIDWLLSFNATLGLIVVIPGIIVALLIIFIGILGQTVNVRNKR